MDIGKEIKRIYIPYPNEADEDAPIYVPNWPTKAPVEVPVEVPAEAQ